jgi:hypothetical protein
MQVALLLNENMRGVADVLELIEADGESGIVLVLGESLLYGRTRAPRDELTVFLCFLHCLVEDGLWDKENL